MNLPQENSVGKPGGYSPPYYRVSGVEAAGLQTSGTLNEAAHEVGKCGYVVKKRLRLPEIRYSQHWGMVRR